MSVHRAPDVRAGTKTPGRNAGRYAAGATALAGAAYALVIRPWELHWGATHAEVLARMPGDDVIDRPQMRSTRAIDIAAPPQAVWPWLVQMGGYTRAGWYSYDRVDNGGRPSATRIVPELQSLRVGDVLPIAPGGAGLTVERIERHRSLVLAIYRPEATTTASFTLRPTGRDRTRLVIRLRMRVARRPRALLFLAAMDAGDFVMMRRMMCGIQRRAELWYASAGAPCGAEPSGPRPVPGPVSAANH